MLLIIARSPRSAICTSPYISFLAMSRRPSDTDHDYLDVYQKAKSIHVCIVVELLTPMAATIPAGGATVHRQSIGYDMTVKNSVAICCRFVNYYCFATIAAC